MNIYLVRHTTPAVAPGICYGQSDIELATSYSQELQQIHGRIPIDTRCYSSPSLRCCKLAHDLSPDVTTDKRLQELNFGDWEMKPWDSLGPEAEAWGDNFVRQRCPGGESFVDLQKRVLDFWQELIKRETKTPVAIITHAGPIRVILCHIKNKPLEQAFSIPVSYGEVILLGDL